MINVEMRMFRGLLGLGDSSTGFGIRWPLVAVVSFCALFWIALGWWLLG